MLLSDASGCVAAFPSAGRPPEESEVTVRIDVVCVCIHLPVCVVLAQITNRQKTYGQTTLLDASLDWLSQKQHTLPTSSSASHHPISP